MSLRSLTLMALLASSASLKLPAPAAHRSRRGVLVNAAGAIASIATSTAAFAKPSELATAGLSKEELYAAARSRMEAERVAALPINRMKTARDRLAGASSLIDAGEWDVLRDLITDTTGNPLNKIISEGGYDDKAARGATYKLRKAVFDVDKFAYSKQSFPGSDVFAGYCAEGVVPRDGKSGCKVKPTVDKGPLLAKIKEALAAYDELIKVAEAAA